MSSTPQQTIDHPALTALRNLMPFVLEDYYEDMALPDFRAAVEAAKKVIDENTDH